jgi:hypothetical protein
MFNKEKTTVHSYNEFSPNKDTESIPLFIPDNEGPWAIRYIWIRKDNENFIENYHSETKGTKSNVRKSSAHLEQYWIPHNALMINQGHFGNIVWRIKTGNPFNNSIDIIEVWRSRKIIESLFLFDSESYKVIDQATTFNPYVLPASPDIKKGGTGLKNGSGLTIDDSNAPKIFKKEDSQQLIKGLTDLGFDIRSWKDYPLISKHQAIDLYQNFESMSKTNDKIKINTGWNPLLNPI